MSFVKKYKNKFIIAIILLCVVILCFTYKEQETVPEIDNINKIEIPDTESTTMPNVEVKSSNKEYKSTPTPDTTEEVQENIIIQNDEPKEEKTEEHSCILSVNCALILENISDLVLGKEDIVPEDGIIFPETEVVFYEGESVFNVLQREMKKNKIHIEFANTPAYNSVYIEGIANLYEHDCGDFSGWIYKVNGEVPQYGCSQYFLKDGDRVEWIYSCS